jgi:DNA mismatch repair ATPase MutS
MIMTKIEYLKNVYGELKTKLPDALILFRWGDWFQAINGDAEIVSNATGRPISVTANIKVCIFGYRFFEVYLPTIAANKKVVICKIKEGGQD